MTDTINISLDLETWGKRPGFDLRSIGACVFAPNARHGGSLVHDGSLGTIKPFYVATDNPIRQSWSNKDPAYLDRTSDEWRTYSLARDPETVQWWNDQSEEAQAAFADPVDLREALLSFRVWLGNVAGSPAPWHNPHIRIWSHGAAFDPPILEATYHAVGLPVPWHYRAPRDTRTLFDVADVGDHSQWMQQFNHGTAHHALDDAISQARCICAAMTIVRGWRYGHDDNAADRPRRYPYADDQCPGHVSSNKTCMNCGTHIDEMRPPEDDFHA